MNSTNRMTRAKYIYLFIITLTTIFSLGLVLVPVLRLGPSLLVGEDITMAALRDNVSKVYEAAVSLGVQGNAGIMAMNIVSVLMYVFWAAAAVFTVLHIVALVLVFGMKKELGNKIVRFAQVSLILNALSMILVCMLMSLLDKQIQNVAGQAGIPAGNKFFLAVPLLVLLLFNILGLWLFVPGITKRRFSLFTRINYLAFIVVGLIILIPIWKVIVDSLDSVSIYQFRLWPRDFTWDGYKVILETKQLYQPFLNSIITTVLGTLLGLVLSTLGGYVLIQFDMPGRNFFAYLILFTMIFSGGMIPEYLVMKQLGLVNNLMVVVIKHGMNVYNLVLMRNFFEGIPQGLFEAARIDGCSPMGIFFKIVLPLSKAALASIGLMFAVGVWNDYTTVKIYITDNNQVNFQYKLRNMIMDGDTPNTAYVVTQNTLFNAAVMSAIIPFMILYPFLQKYFVKGVNIGAVKE